SSSSDPRGTEVSRQPAVELRCGVAASRIPPEGEGQFRGMGCAAVRTAQTQRPPLLASSKDYILLPPVTSSRRDKSNTADGDSNGSCGTPHILCCRYKINGMQ